jgi:hypothetical protein
MPRRLPRLDGEFTRQVSTADAYIMHLEQSRAQTVGIGSSAITITDLEFSYELAFLRIFLGWEIFLESALLRLMCGYHHTGGQEPLATGMRYYAKIVDAELAILGGRNFRLWHNPNDVIGYARRVFYRSRYELVISSAFARLEHFAAIRHRIAHSQKHAQGQFDAATMALAGRRYPASRPGRFLRDWVPRTIPPTRWIFAVSQELSGLAVQICV